MENRRMATRPYYRVSQQRTEALACAFTMLLAMGVGILIGIGI